MNKTITILLILISLIAKAQDFNPKTIRLPENVTVDDLPFLKEELKDVQVVMLGEISHYDGAIFEMKTKVIKYLYQEMGFKTIAFESGIYDVWRAQTDISKGTDVKKSLTNSLFLFGQKQMNFRVLFSFMIRIKWI